jgi:FAD/FMN-containing dehydrogenase
VKENKCHFAIKSGGHARFAGASNADGGVTIDLVRLNSITLSADKKSVTIGAGNRWAEVYRSLEAENLTVIGGRVATVGVGGVILGGESSLQSFWFRRSLINVSNIRWYLIFFWKTWICMRQRNFI